jgi:hypothetical protein
VVLSGRTGPNAARRSASNSGPGPTAASPSAPGQRPALAFVKLGLTRADARPTVSGTAEIDLDGGTSPGGESAELEGRVALSRLDLAMPSALADRLRLASVVVPVRLRKVGPVVELREMSATTDVGSVSASGRLDLGRLGGTELLQGLGELKGDLDVAKLARLAAQDAGDRRGMTSTRGTLHFEATTPRPGPTASASGRRGCPRANSSARTAARRWRGASR